MKPKKGREVLEEVVKLLTCIVYKVSLDIIVMELEKTLKITVGVENVT